MQFFPLLLDDFPHLLVNVATTNKAEVQMTFRALEICVPLMKLEETILILADVKFCSSSSGCHPPGSRRLLEVKLLSFRGTRINEKSEEEQLELINREREKGNNYFQSKDYQLALFTYTCALKIIDSSSTGEIKLEQKDMLLDEKVKCYSNMAACHLKTGNLKETISCCDVVLQHRPQHCKALFRKGKVLAMQQIYPLSIVFLKKALAVQPEHPEIKEEIKTIISTWKKQKISVITEKFGDVSSRRQATRQKSFKNIYWKWTIGISAVALGTMILYKWR
ncbi:peptidyl-prolyl cis-trans isomerase FKBP8-like [Heterodontus francisci]|uniref:peptidyl-prolyl cis-trans isomerase FKBP8-like n=1 Tax=Heterodontus francisci TaxID=7792 RepID=UPI00355BF133